MKFPRTLAEFPWIIVNLRCSLCPRRRGRYRLARLVERFGADALLDVVRRELAKPCHRLRDAGSGMRPGCRVEFSDFTAHLLPSPDLPPKSDLSKER